MIPVVTLFVVCAGAVVSITKQYNLIVCFQPNVTMLRSAFGITMPSVVCLSSLTLMHSILSVKLFHKCLHHIVG